MKIIHRENNLERKEQRVNICIIQRVLHVDKDNSIEKRAKARKRQYTKQQIQKANEQGNRLKLTRSQENENQIEYNWRGGEEVASCTAGRDVNSQSTLHVVDRFCNFQQNNA